MNSFPTNKFQHNRPFRSLFFKTLFGIKLPGKLKCRKTEINKQKVNINVKGARLPNL